LEQRFVSYFRHYNPTAEMMTLWMWETLKDKLPLYTITLWETATSRFTMNQNDYILMKGKLLK